MSNQASTGRTVAVVLAAGGATGLAVSLGKSPDAASAVAIAAITVASVVVLAMIGLLYLLIRGYRRETSRGLTVTVLPDNRAHAHVRGEIEHGEPRALPRGSA